MSSLRIFAPLSRRRAIIMPGCMLHFFPYAPLCAPSRLCLPRATASRGRLIALAIGSLSLSSVSLAQDTSCPPNVPLAQNAPSTAQNVRNGAGGAATQKSTEEAGQGKIDVTSDAATLGTNGDATLQGNVRVRQGDREIRAEDVEYDGENNAFKVKGQVDYTDSAIHVRGNDGNYSPTEGADFKAAEFEMLERSGRGMARSLNMTPQGVLRLEGVQFTTCPLNDQSWQVSASSLRLDTGQELGTGRGARVDFKGVPILYLPWMSFPLGDQRKSGFLFPNAGNSSRSGFQLTVPYYFNIAPNADFTFEPVFYAQRGVDVGGEARFMTEHQNTKLAYSFLPGDDIAQRDRSYVSLNHRTELPANFRFNIDAANASDMNYFEDFAQGPEGTSVAFVERLAQLTYRDENWRFAAEAQQFQTIITDQLLDPQQPYARAPRILGSADFGLGRNGIFRYGFDSEIVNFQRDTGVTGWRVDATPNVGLDFEVPGFFFRPGVSYRYTSYSLDDTVPGQDDKPSRSLPIATVDTGLLFERPSGTNGRRTLTLEPRALYLYVPFENQDNLPMFDTGLPDLSLVQLFRTNRYVGADRVSDANQVSFGVTSRLLDTASGTQFVQGTFGQTVYINAPRVTIPGEIARTSNTSDLIAQLTLTAYKDWNIDVGTQWNPSGSSTQRSQVNLQYRPSNDEVYNIGYRFQRGRIEQGDVSAALPLGQRWAAYSRVVYSLRDNKTLDRFAGLEFRSCCWKARFVGRRFVRNNTGDLDTAFFLQLELTGLASVGGSANTFLESAIRGYSPLDSTL
jgi:LPS-assembly protein